MQEEEEDEGAWMSGATGAAVQPQISDPSGIEKHQAIPEQRQQRQQQQRGRTQSCVSQGWLLNSWRGRVPVRLLADRSLQQQEQMRGQLSVL